MPNRFKFVCRAINQARLKKTSKWVHKLGLAAASKEGAAAQATDVDGDAQAEDGEDEPVEDEGEEEDEAEKKDEDDLPLSQLSEAAVKEPDSEKQQGVDGAVGASEVGAQNVLRTVERLSRASSVGGGECGRC